MFGFFKRGGDKSDMPARIERAISTILSAMYYVAIADGRVEASEVSVIRELLKRLKVDASDALVRDHLAQFAMMDKAGVLAFFHDMAEGVDGDVKEMTLRAVILVTLSDGEFAGAESRAIGEIIAALEIDGATVDRVREDVNALLTNAGR